MKSLTTLWQKVADELSATGCRVSTAKDYEYVLGRVENEGVSFLTITLPTFCDDLQKALSQEEVTADLWKGLKRHNQSVLPAFLYGFSSLVFEPRSGRLLDEPSIDAIFAMRQLTLMFGKIQLECTEKRIQAAIDKYIQCEQEVKDNDAKMDEFLLDRFKTLSSMLYADVFQRVDEDVFYGRILPKHGPGVTADRLSGNRKYDQTEWPSRLEGVFPSGENLFPSWRYHEEAQEIRLLEPGAERPVRVITVPKTLKTPRIIAVEPTCMQYMQQGLLLPLVEQIEGDDILSSLIGFTDQTPNQRMACEGSDPSILGYLCQMTGKRTGLATLDLSEASDRVSNQLVRALFRNHPNLAEGVDATRSRKAVVPGHGVIRLAKYASMGSALCFPVEAMVFLTIVLMGIEDELNRPLTRKDLTHRGGFAGGVRVYGDDIIVPRTYARSVARMLEAFGLRVNLNKSFWSGNFRESCGKEYYSGEDVSVTRVRQLLPTRQSDTKEIIASVSLRNRFYQAGLWETATYLDGLLEEVIPLPTINDTSPVLGRWTFLSLEHEGERTDPFFTGP